MLVMRCTLERERDARGETPATRDAARATDEVGQSRETQPTRCTYCTLRA